MHNLADLKYFKFQTKIDPFINGCQLIILLYEFKLATLTLFQRKNSFE